MLFFNFLLSQNKKTKMLGPFYFLTKNVENDLLFVYHSGSEKTSVQEDYSEHTMVGSGNSMIPGSISTHFISSEAFFFSSS